MSWLVKLLTSGFVIEGLVSQQPGFELISMVDVDSGRRLLYWRRSGRITVQTVEHLKKFLRVRYDKLFIEFTDKPQIDPKAESALRQLFHEVEIRSRKELGEEQAPLPEIVELYGGDVVVVRKKKTRGSLRLYEADRVLHVLDKLDSKTMWILVIELTKEGKLRIIDDYKEAWRKHAKRVTEEGSRIVILAVWHGQHTTDLFLLYPPIEEKLKQ